MAVKDRLRQGFTIVELLIVVVLIAVLAAITIVAYNGLQKRAQTAAVSTALNQANKKVKLYQVDNNAYPTTLAIAGITDDEVTYQYSGTTTTFCITGTQGSTSLYIGDTVTKPTEGGCAGHGQGGVAAITNLATVPRATQASSEWLPRYGMAATHINNASDGPTATLTSYYRQMQSVAATGTGRGIDHRGNVDLVTPQADSVWSVAAGETVFISIYTRSSLTNSDLRMAYRIHNGAGAWLTPQQLVMTTNYGSANTWVRLTGSFTASVTGHFQLTTRYQTSATWPIGATIDGTGLMIVKTSNNPTYADPIVSSSWIWNGAANAATSTGPAL